MKCLGLMSGTSMDGVDCAVIDVTPGRSTLRITLLAHRTDPYPPAIREQLLSLVRTGTVETVCRLHAAVGEVFARVAGRTIRQAKLSATDVAVIGSHGQTVWHGPKRVPVAGIGSIRSSLQIGDPSVIAERTGIMSVADFRARDLAAGGEGAPLTPYVHYHVFRSRNTSRLIVNLGGIANVTWLPKNGGLRDVVAFDVGPCNLLLDGLMRQATRGQQSIDRNGALAVRGCPQDVLVTELLRHPFLARRPPKSTGREEFGEGYIRHVRRVAARHGLSLDDTLASSCVAIARTIRQSGSWAVDEVIVGGGGVRNRGLLRAVKREFEPGHVTSMERAGVKSQALEAMAFAVLAHETIRGVPANLPWVTGAASPVVLGTVIPGRKPVVFTK
ncbi:MAG: anhydro-N-acetylmuramic acid kinase [Nitrospira sp. SB0666_bin_27]|nr:anhydro-N-acetylmuramic acid kinase [Nitrospira sp. SB0666_bin_27]